MANEFVIKHGFNCFGDSTIQTNDNTSSTNALKITNNDSPALDLLTVRNDGVVSIGTSLIWVESATTLTITGHLAATTKSFEIDHPTTEGKKLIHGALEGPEHGVYVRGELKDDNIIALPDYWKGLVDKNSITVQLTSISRACIHYVEGIIDYNVHVECDDGRPHCYYFIQGERKDVDKLQTEK